MERRDALKTIGVGSMAVFTSTALFGALQSCGPAARVDWTPVFFSQDEAATVEKLCGVILPATDTPGAVEAGVPPLLDSALASIYEDREADYFKRGLAVFAEKYRESQKTSLNKAPDEQVEAVLNEYLERYKTDESFMQDFNRQMEDETGEKDDVFVETYFITQLTRSTFWGYYTSELVGETVMAYDPIPVVYQGCIPLEPGQKSWSSV